MYCTNWIQSLWQASVHSYERSSVAHEAKNNQFPGSKNTQIFSNFLRCGAPLAKMGMKQFHLAALLDVTNVLRSNESNPNGETSHFAAAWTLQKIIHGVTGVSFPM